MVCFVLALRIKCKSGLFLDLEYRLYLCNPSRLVGRQACMHTLHLTERERDGEPDHFLIWQWSSYD